MHHYYHYITPSDPLLHTLIDWPFLTFIFALVVVAEFRKPISSLLYRKFSFKIGGNEVSFDEYKNFVDQESAVVADQSTLSTEAQVSSKTELTSIDVQRIYQSLNSTQFEWRTLAKLAQIAEAPEDIVRKRLLEDPNILITRSKSGWEVVKLKIRA